MTTTRDRSIWGFADWRPQKQTQVLLDQVHDILDEYQEHLPVTIRQIFYRLVGRYDYPKDEKAYKRLREKLTRARRAKMISFEDIRDDGITIDEPHSWLSPNHALRTFASWAADYRIDRQRFQDQDIRIWCEAAGMVPQLASLVSEYSIPVQSSGGADSLTARYQAAKDITRPTVILHIGDHDPDGLVIFNALKQDVTKFCRQIGHAPPPRVERIAVTEDQVTDLGLITQPRKDTAIKEYVGLNGDEDLTCQAEAIAPDEMASIVLEAVHEWIDPDAHAKALRVEAKERRGLTAKLKPLLA